MAAGASILVPGTLQNPPHETDLPTGKLMQDPLYPVRILSRHVPQHSPNLFGFPFKRFHEVLLTGAMSEPQDPELVLAPDPARPAGVTRF